MELGVGRRWAITVAYTVVSGEGVLYLVNNYSTPVSVQYSIVPVPITSSLIIGELMGMASMVLGIIGVILVILGAVLKPKG